MSSSQASSEEVGEGRGECEAHEGQVAGGPTLLGRKEGRGREGTYTTKGKKGLCSGRPLAVEVASILLHNDSSKQYPKLRLFAVQGGHTQAHLQA